MSKCRLKLMPKVSRKVLKYAHKQLEITQSILLPGEPVSYTKGQRSFRSQKHNTQTQRDAHAKPDGTDHSDTAGWKYPNKTRQSLALWKKLPLRLL